MVNDRAFMFHICIPCNTTFFFGTMAKVICQGQGQISRSHIKKKGGHRGGISSSVDGIKGLENIRLHVKPPARPEFFTGIDNSN